MSVEEKPAVSGHSNVVGEIIREENFTKVAEIGVWKGGTTRKILKKLPDLVEEYWAVDPWEVMDEMERTRTEGRRTKWHWDEYHKYVCGLMLHFPQLRVLRMTSEQASEVFPDGYFDMIYVDAIHTFDYLNADIGYWLPKVREGGILSGHDYGGRRFPGVKEAVDKWFGEDIKLYPLDGVWVKRI